MAHGQVDKVQASTASIEEPAYVFELAGSIGIVWMILGTCLVLASAAGVAAVYHCLGRRAELQLVPMLIAIVAVLPIHELVHAGAVLAVGGRPRFGAGFKSGMPVLWVTYPGQRVSRDAALAIALAPLMLIDVVGVALICWQPSWTWAAVAIVVNTSGAIGDLWFTGLLARFPRWALVEDRETGFAVWAPSAESRKELVRRAPRLRVAVPGALGAWLAITFVLFLLLAFGLTILQSAVGDHMSLAAHGARQDWTFGFGWLTLAEVHIHGAGYDGGLRVLPTLLVAAVLSAPLALLWTALRSRRRERTGPGAQATV